MPDLHRATGCCNMVIETISIPTIKMVLGETGWYGMEWIGLDEDGDQWRALVNAVTNFEVP
jgi:hypothetical protein